MDNLHTPRMKKVDISSKITGKLLEDRVLFYIDKTQIGSVQLSSNPPQYELSTGFGVENHKIYQLQEEGKEDESYVEGCDMGWC